MAFAHELAGLFERDLSRLLQQLDAWGDHPALWHTQPGIANSAGNLTLHLEGNLRHFIGRQLGQQPYQRQRDQEFSLKDLPVSDLVRRIQEVRELVPHIIRSLSDAQLNEVYPGDPLGSPIVTRQFLIHLLGHLNYHLGQIDYARRTASLAGPVTYTQLSR